MDILRAKEILEGLADGVNPLTGEVLSASDSCNQVEVVRALHTVLRYLDIPHDKVKKPQSGNMGKPWSSEDDEILCRMFETGCSVQDMCNHFLRSRGGIAARLVRLGKINSRDELRSK